MVIGTSFLLLLVFLACIGVAQPSASERKYETQRQRMVRTIAAAVKGTRARLGKEALDRRVMQAMGSVPRHAFVPPASRRRAYSNRPLPIGHGQTISQPFIVAVMTDLLGTDEDDVVLEIGTGSGYQTAILAELVQHVFSIEIIPQLAKAARQQLQSLGYTNVTTRVSDGYYGWEEHAPFDAIIVTAAAHHIPPPLLRQLKPGGRIVIPVGSPFLTQQLMLVRKTTDGKVRTRQMLPVRFVPLTGQH